MSWLRRNLAALLVIVLALPALAFVLVGVPLLDDAGREEFVTVKQGDSIEIDGYSVTLTATQEFVGTGTGPDTNNIPLGSSLVGALFEFEPGDEPLDGSCDAELTSRAGGVDRTWPTLASPRDFSYQVGEDRTTVCLLDGEAFELETVFLTPAGAHDEATIDVTVGFATYRFVPDRE